MVKVISSPTLAYAVLVLSDSIVTDVSVGAVLSIVTELPAEETSAVFPEASANVNA